MFQPVAKFLTPLPFQNILDPLLNSPLRYLLQSFIMHPIAFNFLFHEAPGILS